MSIWNPFSRRHKRNHRVHARFEAWSERPTTPAIRFQNVSYYVDPEEPILQEVSFTVAARESYIILGGSGAGKSTMIRLTLGLIKPVSGEVWIDGFEISRMSELDLIELRRHVGIVFQEGALFDSLTLLENVEFPLVERLHMKEEEARRRALEVLALVDLEGHEDKYPAELSGGMKRRGGIARAMVTRPSILLYDEPTAGLDPITSRNIVDLIVKLRDLRGVTSVIVTHDLDSAFRIARCRMETRNGQAFEEVMAVDDPRIRTQFLVLNEGVTVFQGSLPELLASQDPYVVSFLGPFTTQMKSSSTPPSHISPRGEP